MRTPIRIHEGANLVTIAQLSILSRLAFTEGIPTRASAREVGIFRAPIASDPKNSLIEDRVTANPSANRLNGVLPAPLS